MTSVRDLYDGIATSAERAEGATKRVAEGVEALAKAAREVKAPASFAPSPGSAIAPGGVVQVGAEGARVGTGGGAASGTQFTLAANPLIYPRSPDGWVVRRSDLEAFLADGTCWEMELPSGGTVISCPFGQYPGLAGGVLSTVSAGGGGGAGGAGGGGGTRSRLPTGNQDRTRRFGSADNADRSRALGSSTAGADSRAVVDELRGVRSDLQRMGRALEGDGGAGLRFGGGL